MLVFEVQFLSPESEDPEFNQFVDNLLDWCEVRDLNCCGSFVNKAGKFSRLILAREDTDCNDDDMLAVMTYLRRVGARRFKTGGLFSDESEPPDANANSSYE